MAITLILAASAGAQTLTVTNDLALWLKADAIKGLTDGQSVEAWPDSSPDGHDATQFDPNKQPVYFADVQNGLPVVRFDGNRTAEGANADRLVTVTLAPMENISVFLVAKSDRGACTYALTFGSPYYGVIFGFQSDNNPANAGKWGWYHRTSKDAESFTPLADLAAKTFQLIAHTGGSTLKGPWTIGSDPTGMTSFQGDIAEVLVYDTSLNAADRQKVMKYLNAKWALP